MNTFTAIILPALLSVFLLNVAADRLNLASARREIPAGPAGDLRLGALPRVAALPGGAHAFRLVPRGGRPPGDTPVLVLRRVCGTGPVGAVLRPRPDRDRPDLHRRAGRPAVRAVAALRYLRDLRHRTSLRVQPDHLAHLRRGRRQGRPVVGRARAPGGRRRAGRLRICRPMGVGRSLVRRHGVHAGGPVRGPALDPAAVQHLHPAGGRALRSALSRSHAPPVSRCSRCSSSTAHAGRPSPTPSSPGSAPTDAPRCSTRWSPRIRSRKSWRCWRTRSGTTASTTSCNSPPCRSCTPGLVFFLFSVLMTRPEFFQAFEVQTCDVHAGWSCSQSCTHPWTW